MTVTTSLSAEISTDGTERIKLHANLASSGPTTKNSGCPLALSPMRTVQCEYRLFPGTDHVDMRGPMVVRIDDDAQAIETERRWHGFKLP